jgi:hypothetical protein
LLRPAQLFTAVHIAYSDARESTQIYELVYPATLGRVIASFCCPN